MTGLRKSSKKARKNPSSAAEPPPRVKRRERRREQSRDEIVEAARRVLLRDGLSKATLEAVAKEVGLTKATIYYYFPSKDALFFELMFNIVDSQYRAIHEGVEKAKDGGEALAAIIRETVQLFAPRMDDFRLAFLHAQIDGPGNFQASDEQLARIRPLNELAFAKAAKLLNEGRDPKGRDARVEPRLMAFLASIAAIGALTMKGMVESAGDPLRYTDEQLIDGLSKIFAAASKA